MTSTLPTSFFRIGDEVSVNHPKYPGVWVIESFGPVNAVLRPQGGGRNLRAPRTMLIDPVTPGTVSFADAQPYVAFYPGEIVRIESGRFQGTYVVIADKGAKVNVALLGGDSGRYVRSIRQSLVKVDPSEVLA